MVVFYEIYLTFGLSAILSFIVSVTVLLIIVAAKRGMFRMGAAQNKTNKLNNPLLVPTAPPLVHKLVEMTPLQNTQD